MAITGLYLYSSKVFQHIDESIKNGITHPGELEITDINRFFMKNGTAKGITFDCHWADCGTIDALIETSLLTKKWNKGAWLKKKSDIS